MKKDFFKDPKIKFPAYEPWISNEDKKIVNKTLNQSMLTLGPQLEKFENDFCKYSNSKYAIAVSNCTAALHLSLMALGIKKDDEVIIPDLTFVADANAILACNAKPVIADINKENFFLSLSNIKKNITKKTKAIIPVHIYGQVCNIEEILDVAKDNNLKVIEDCAHAVGTFHKSKHVGTLGNTGCFSFYPTKILGTYGDGGFILTNNKEIYEKAKRIRFYGIEMENKSNKFFNKYYANENGVNSRLDEIQSGILNFKLKKINEYINLRRKKARLYLKLLNKTELILPKENNDNFHVYHLFTVFHEKRDAIIKKLNNSRIYTRVIYPYPIKNMKPYQSLKSKKLINTNKISKGIFSLPLYPELPDKYIVKVSNILKEILKKIND